jgi:hypothetical protein
MVDRTSLSMTLFEITPKSMVSLRATGPLGGAVLFTLCQPLGWFHTFPKQLRKMNKRQGRGGEHTVKWSLRASNFRKPFPWILCLPNTVDPIKCPMKKVEERIAGTGEGIILQTTDGKVASSVHVWLGDGGREFPSVGTFFEADDIVAAEEEFHILGAKLVAPEEVDVAGQTAGVVFECIGESAG